MQHSDKKTYINRIAAVVVFFVIFMLINVALDIMLEYPEAKSEKMLTEYTQQKDIDVIIVGNSITKMIDCKIVNEKVGCNAYNMGTPSQTLSISEKIIKMSAEQNPIKKVVFFTGFDSFEKDDVPVFERVFNKTRISSRPYFDRLLTTLYLKLEEATEINNIKSTESIILWFDWIENHVDDLDSIKKNINSRVIGFFNGNRLGKDFAFDLDKKVYDRNAAELNDDDELIFDEDMEILRQKNISKGVLDVDELKKLDEICKYCRDNSIELIYFISPHQVEYKERYNDNYDKLDEYLDYFISKRGGSYYNFESDPQIHMLLPDNYFYDWEHVQSSYRNSATDVFIDKYQALNGAIK